MRLQEFFFPAVWQTPSWWRLDEGPPEEVWECDEEDPLPQVRPRFQEAGGHGGPRSHTFWTGKRLLTKAKKGLSKLAQLFLNINVYWYSLYFLHGPLFIYFCPFLNTMTNIVQNLTTNGKSIDVIIGIRTQDHGMVIAY